MSGKDVSVFAGAAAWSLYGGEADIREAGCSLINHYLAGISRQWEAAVPYTSPDALPEI